MPVLTVVCPTCRSFLQLPQPVPAGQPIRCRICSATFLSGTGATKEADTPPPEKRPAPVKPKRPPRKKEVAVEPGDDDRAWLQLQQQQRKQLAHPEPRYRRRPGAADWRRRGDRLLLLRPGKEAGEDAQQGATSPTDSQPPPGPPEEPIRRPSRRTEEEEPSRPPTKRTEEEDPLRAPPLRSKPKVEDP